jgi:hypothetical protein
MIKYIKKIWSLFFGSKKYAKKQQKRTSLKAPKEHFGAHYYLGDLLDRLEQTFKHLPKIRKADRDAWDLYSKVGATVCDSNALWSIDVQPHIIKAMPSFGCAFIGGDIPEDKDILPARFMYFMRVKKPVNVQPSNGVVYRVGMTLDDDDAPIYCGFYVSVDGGNIRALRELISTPHIVGSTTSSKHPSKQIRTIHRMSWGYPRTLSDKAEELGMGCDTLAEQTFAVIANAAYSRESGMTVTVRKHSKKAVFAIDMLRTPYFFADREKVADENGSTKKILHYVRGHTRTLAGGSEKFIKPHFRGLNTFKWNGYDVRIGMGGKHGLSLSSFNLEPIPELEEASNFIGMDGLADKLEGKLA